MQLLQVLLTAGQLRSSHRGESSKVIVQVCSGRVVSFSGGHSNDEGVQSPTEPGVEEPSGHPQICKPQDWHLQTLPTSCPTQLCQLARWLLFNILAEFAGGVMMFEHFRWSNFWRNRCCGDQVFGKRAVPQRSCSTRLGKSKVHITWLIEFLNFMFYEFSLPGSTHSSLKKDKEAKHLMTNQILNIIKFLWSLYLLL